MASRCLTEKLWILIVLSCFVFQGQCSRESGLDSGSLETLDVLNSPLSDLSLADLILDDISQRQSEIPRGFSNVNPLDKVLILHMEFNLSEDQPDYYGFQVTPLYAIFKPEFDDETIDDYEITVVSSDEKIIKLPEDFDEPEALLITFEEELNAFNVTAHLAFQRGLGPVELNFRAVQKNARPDSELVSFDSEKAQFFISGIQVHELGDPEARISRDVVDYNDLIDPNQPRKTYGFLVVTPQKQDSRDEPVSLDDMQFIVDDPNFVVNYDQGPTGACAPNDGTWNGESIDFTPNCHVAATDNLVGGNWEGSFFGFLLNQYRVGTVVVRWSWPTFGDGVPSIVTPEYNGTFTLEVGGDPPPVVTQITPDGPFRTGGDETVTVFFFNAPDSGAETEANVQFQLELTQSRSLFQFVPNSYEFDRTTGIQSVKFLTPPAPQGIQTNLQWIFRVIEVNTEPRDARDETGGYLFNYVGTPSILRLEPDRAQYIADTPTIIKIVGTFPGATFDDSGRDVVLLNGLPIKSRQPTINEEKTEIEFELPPKPGANFVYPVSVRVDTIETNSVPFTYLEQPLIRIIALDGVNLTEPGNPIDRYSVSRDRDNTFKAEFLAGNFEGASYTWALNTIGGQSINLDDAGVDSSQLFFVAPGDLFLDAEQFLLGLIVRTIDNLQGSDQVELEVRAGDSFGLYLPEPLPVKRKDGEFRTAAIELSSRGLDPTKSYTYEYTWTWMGNTETWTVTSPPTGQAITSVNKLGRTFKILNSETTPGGVEPITVTVKVTGDDFEQTSTVATVVRTLPRELFAIIGNGGSGSDVNINVNFVLTGENSFDDSILPGEGPTNAGLAYEWIGCEYSLSASFVDAKDCLSIIIGDRSDQQRMTVGPSRWAQIREGGRDASTYVKFTLKITKDGEEDTAEAEYILRDINEPYTEVSRFQFTDLDGNEVTPSSVNFLSPLVITPVIDDGLPPGGTFQYEFRVADFDLEDFLSVPGSYQLPDTSGPDALALRAGSMEPARNYEIVAQFSAPNFESSRYVVNFRTMDKPTFVVQPLARSGGNSQSGDANGNTEFSTTVTSTAGTGFFKVMYRLFAADDLETPLACLSGCNGVDDASFFICTSGEYRVQAQIVDVTTSYVYGTEFTPPVDESPITITLGTEDVLNFVSPKLTACTASGDDGCLFMLGLCLARVAKETSPSSRLASPIREDVDNISLDVVRQQEDIVSLIRRASAEYLRLTSTSVLNTYSMQTLATIFAGFTKGREATVNDVTTVDQLLESMYNMINRVADGTNLGFTAPTLEFLYDVGDIAVKVGIPPTTRRRLLQGGDQVNQAVLDTDAVGTIVVPFMDVSQAACGFDVISSTGYEGRSETTAYGITEWACRVVCNSDQIDNFEFRAGANSMTSCGGFATSGFRTALCFETMPDIVELSKVQTEGFSDTPGLMKIIAPIPLGPDGINKEIPDNCFNVQTRVVAEDPSLIDDPKPVRYVPQKGFPADDVAQGEAYKPETSGVFAIPCDESTGTGNCNVLEAFNFTTNLFDVVGVQALAAGPVTPIPPGPTETPSATDAPGGGGLSTGAIVGIAIGSFFLLLLILLICLIYFFLVPPPPDDDDDEPAFEYVERDIYGRGFVIEQSAASDMISGLLQSGTLSGTVSGTLSGTL